MTALLLTACGSDDKDNTDPFTLNDNLKVASADSLAGVWLLVKEGASKGSSSREQDYIVDAKDAKIEDSYENSSKEKALVLITEKPDNMIAIQYCDSDSDELTLKDAATDTYDYESKYYGNGEDKDPTYTEIFTLTFTDNTSASGSRTEDQNDEYDDDIEEYNSETNEYEKLGKYTRTYKGSSNSTIQAIKISNGKDFKAVGDDDTINLSLLESYNDDVIDEAKDFAISCFHLTESIGTSVKKESNDAENVSYTINGSGKERSLIMKGKDDNDDELSLEVTEFNSDSDRVDTDVETKEITKSTDSYKSTDFDITYIEKRNEDDSYNSFYPSSLSFSNERRKVNGKTVLEINDWAGSVNIGSSGASADIDAEDVQVNFNAYEEEKNTAIFEFSLSY